MSKRNPRIATIAGLLFLLSGVNCLWAGGQLRRLSNYEYNRSLRDLFDFDFGVESHIQKDNISEGFTNNSAVAFTTPDRVHGYLAESHFVVQTVLGLNDFLVLKQRFWDAEEILEANPNRSLWTTIGRLINDFQNHVKDGQRVQILPNLGMRRLRNASGEKVQALELQERARFTLRHDFPIDATYRVTVHGAAWKSRESATITASIDGLAVPVLFELSPRSEGLEPRAIEVPIPRGTRSLEFSVPVRQQALVSGVEIAGPLLPGTAPTVPGTVPAVPASRGPADPRAPLASRLPCIVPAASDRASARECAAQTIRSLATRAFRSVAVSDSTVDALLLPFQSAYDGGVDFRNALGLSMEAVLLDPRFLYRVEFAPLDSAVSRVNDYEFAARLSYFLWGSLPDEELLRLASGDQLVNSPGSVRAQVGRMLADPRSNALVESFAFGWLGIHALPNHVVDKKTFADFDEELRQAMFTETQLYLEAFFRENWPIRDLIDSGTLFLNERLAGHYGIANVRGNHFRRVESAAGNRRGLLTQGAVLTLTSQSNSTSVVKRGLWMLERMLCSTVGEVPPNVPALEESAARGLTLRQQLEKHRASPVCSACHRRIDPLGFSLEHYDGTGRWRNVDGDSAIDAAGTLQSPKGPVSFKDFAELRTILKDDPRIPACVTRKLMTYALGRSLNSADEAALAEILAKTQDGGARIQDVLTEITLSAPFRNHSR